MIGRETRMLLRHYLEQGGSKSAVARQLGINRDTLHRWIRAGDLDRDLRRDTPPLWAAPASSDEARSLGSQLVLPTVRFSPATTVSFTTAVNTRSQTNTGACLGRSVTSCRDVKGVVTLWMLPALRRSELSPRKMQVTYSSDR
jgi:transposase-like protein